MDEKKSIEFLSHFCVHGLLLNLLYDYDNTEHCVEVINSIKELAKLIQYNVRDYIISGDETYFRKYKESVAIYDGLTGWSNVFNHPYFWDKQMKITSLLKGVGIGEKAMEYVSKALNNIRDLVKIDVKAINWNTGFSNPENTQQPFTPLLSEYIIQYPVLTVPKPQEAIDLIYNEQYLDKTEDIQELLDQALYLTLNLKNNLIKSKKVFLVMCILVFMAYTYKTCMKTYFYYLMVYLVFCITVIIHYEKFIIRNDVAHATWRLSEIQTNLMRNYIVGSEDKLYDRYWKIIRMRQGKEPWDTVFAVDWFKDRFITISDLYQLMKFNEEVISELNKYLELSTQMRWINVRVRNLIEGYADESGEAKKAFDAMKQKKHIQFGTKVEPNNREALILLFSDEYTSKKKQAKIHCDNAYRLISGKDHFLKKVFKVLVGGIPLFSFTFLHLDQNRYHPLPL